MEPPRKKVVSRGKGTGKHRVRKKSHRHVEGLGAMDGGWVIYQLRGDPSCITGPQCVAAL